MSDSQEASLSRRRLFKFAGGASCFFALPKLMSGCKAVNANSQALNESVQAGDGSLEAWLDRIGPIEKITGPTPNFGGDEPLDAHPILRDKTQKPTAVTAATEEFDVVVIGGGMSGLGVAYRILADFDAAKKSGKQMPARYANGLKIAVLEQASRFGGNSKGESWNNIRYTIAAAYLVSAEPGEDIYDNFYKPLGIDKLWRSAGEDPVELDGKLYKGFWDAVTIDPSDEEGVRLIRQAKADFEQIANLKEGERDRFGFFFPDIPVTTEEGYQQIEVLDQKSFHEILTERYPYKNTGKMHPHMETLIEHYCWSSFAGSSFEISAAAGLNFLCGEFLGIKGLPGGNAQAARQILKGIAQYVPQQNLRTNVLVHKVENAGGGVEVEYTVARANPANGVQAAPGKIKAQLAIMAAPKFVAAKIMPQMPQSHKDIITGKMKWRAYLVANALYEEEVKETDQTDFLDCYLLGNGKTIVGEPGESGGKPTDDEHQARLAKECDEVNATDLLQSQWSQRNPELTGSLKLTEAEGKRTVLSFFRGFPYDRVREKIIPYPVPADAAAYAAKEKEMLDQYKATFTKQIEKIAEVVLGMKTKPVEVRVARWGHPLCLARQGLFRRALTQPFQNGVGKIFYCNQDNWSLPAIETALGEALTVAAKVKTRLGYS